MKGRRQRMLPRHGTRTVERRILDAMIHLVHERGWQPRLIYLTDDDRVQLPLRNHDYIGGLEVRAGKQSYVYATCRRGVKI